jgi:hypothetical protein
VTFSQHPYLEGDATSPFPPHNPEFPDVNPATGDERETTDGKGKPL